ncbi:MAG: hypothetical protein HQ518_03020 [Rhodopirellula sp.]|nr:hypothetical protein [Rhodopirellula sp.]
MAIRLVEIVLPVDQCHSVPELLDNFQAIGIWQESHTDTHRLTRVLVAERPQAIRALQLAQQTTVGGVQAV